MVDSAWYRPLNVRRFSHLDEELLLMTLTAQPLPNDYVNATWPDVLPRFDALATMPLSLDNVERWLADWSALESAVSEAIQLASVAYTVDTTDPVKEAAYQRMAGEIEPHMDEQRVRLVQTAPGARLHPVRSGNDHPGLSESGRDLPRRECAATAGIAGARRRVSKDHRRNDRRMGRRNHPACPPAALPVRYRSRYP